MPMLNGNLGTGDVRGSVQPNNSLLYRMVEVTPETVSLRAFTPFTDFGWRDMNTQMGRTLADFTAPVALWSTPQTGEGAKRQMDIFPYEGKLSYTNTNRKDVEVDQLTDEDAAELLGPNLIEFLTPLMINSSAKSFAWNGASDGDKVFAKELKEPDKNISLSSARQKLAASFGTGAAQMGWNPTTGTPLFWFKFYPTACQGSLNGENIMYNELGKYSGENMNVIGVTMDEGNITFHYTQSMIETVLIKMRDAVERMQRWTPITVPIGSGVLEKVGDSGVYVNQGITDRWVSGSVAYRGQRIPSAGTIYIPDDFMPYSAKRRAAPYHNIWHTCWINWMREACETSDGTSMDEAIAMSTMILADKAGFSLPGAVPSSPLDPESITDRSREFLALPFAKSYIDFDPASYLGLSNLDADKLRNKDGWASPDFQKKCATWWLTSISLACASNQTAALSAPGFLLYDGGPRPDQIGEQLKLSYRPDVSTGSYSNPWGVTMIQSEIQSGIRQNRFPTLIRSFDALRAFRDNAELKETVIFADDIKSLDDIKDQNKPILPAGKMCQWIGIRDPLIIPDVRTVTLQDGRPDTMIEEDYYFYTPKVMREGMTAATYKKRRKFLKVIVPRPDTHFALPCRRGFMVSWVSDTQAVPSQGFYTTIDAYAPRPGKNRYTYQLRNKSTPKKLTPSELDQIGAGDVKDMADTFMLVEQSQRDPALLAQPTTITDPLDAQKYDNFKPGAKDEDGGN